MPRHACSGLGAFKAWQAVLLLPGGKQHQHMKAVACIRNKSWINYDVGKRQLIVCSLWTVSLLLLDCYLFISTIDEVLSGRWLMVTEMTSLFVKLRRIVSYNCFSNHLGESVLTLPSRHLLPICHVTIDNLVLHTWVRSWRSHSPCISSILYETWRYVESGLLLTSVYSAFHSSSQWKCVAADVVRVSFVTVYANVFQNQAVNRSYATECDYTTVSRTRIRPYAERRLRSS